MIEVVQKVLFSLRTKQSLKVTTEVSVTRLVSVQRDCYGVLCFIMESSVKG